MKNFLIALITLVTIGSSARALPVGNPGDTAILPSGILWEGLENSPYYETASWCDSLNIKTGFYGDYVLNRFLESRGPKTITVPIANTPNPAHDKKLTSSEISTEACYAALNIWNRFEVFGTVGSSNARFKGSSASFNLVGVFGAAGTTAPNRLLNNGTVSIQTKSIFSWSAGLKHILYKKGNFYCGVEGQYAQFHPDIENINVICNYAQFIIHNPKGYDSKSTFPLPTTAPTSTAKLHYSEWQGGLGCAYKISIFSPYVAFKISKAFCKMDRLHIKQPTSTVPNPASPPSTGAVINTTNRDLQSVSLILNNLNSRNIFGAVAGITFIDFECLSLNAEARLIDERAVSISSTLRF